MSDVPIIDVQIDTSKFDAFLNDFEKHKEAVGALPGVWHKMNEGIQASAATLKEVLTATQATAAATQAMVANQEKFANRAASSGHTMERLARETKGVVKSLGEGAEHLLKWVSLTGIVGGLLGAGSLWGIERLALAAGGARRSALGLGVTSGEQQAFGINFSRVLDNPSALLEGIANAQNDPRQAAPLMALGIRDYQGKDAAQLAPEVLDAIRKQAKRTDPALLGPTAEAFGWTNFASMDEIRRLRDTPDDEWRKLQTNNAANRGALALDPSMQRAWQDLTTQLNVAGQTIENTLIRGLVPLAGPLGHLSQGVVDVVAAFSKSPLIKQWLDQAGAGLEQFAKYIETPAFKADVESFVEHIGQLAKALGGAFDWLIAHVPGLSPSKQAFGSYGPQLPTGGDDYNAWLAGKKERDAGNNETWQEKLGLITAPGKHFQLGDIEKVGHDYFRANGWSEAQVAGMLAGVNTESGWNPSAVSKDGGAHGLFQLRGAREKLFEKIYGVPAEQAGTRFQLDFAQYELEHGEQGAASRLRQANTPEAAYKAFERHYERPGDADFAQHYAGGVGRAEGYYGRFGGSPVIASPAPTKVDLHVHNQTSAQFSVSAAMAAVP